MYCVLKVAVLLFRREETLRQCLDTSESCGWPDNITAASVGKSLMNQIIKEGKMGFFCYQFITSNSFVFV